MKSKAGPPALTTRSVISRSRAAGRRWRRRRAARRPCGARRRTRRATQRAWRPELLAQDGGLLRVGRNRGDETRAAAAAPRRPSPHRRARGRSSARSRGRGPCRRRRWRADRSVRRCARARRAERPRRRRPRRSRSCGRCAARRSRRCRRAWRIALSSRLRASSRSRRSSPSTIALVGESPTNAARLAIGCESLDDSTTTAPRSTGSQWSARRPGSRASVNKSVTTADASSRAARDGLERVPARPLGRPRARRLRDRGNRGQRRAQLVRGVGGEEALALAARFQRRDRRASQDDTTPARR